MVPLGPRKWPCFTNFSKGLSYKLGFFLGLLFEPILEAGYLNKMLALLNKKPTFVLVFGFLAVVLSQVCPIFV